MFAPIGECTREECEAIGSKGTGRDVRSINRRVERSTIGVKKKVKSREDDRRVGGLARKLTSSVGRNSAHTESNGDVGAFIRRKRGATKMRRAHAKEDHLRGPQSHMSRR